ncbi:MAG: phosphoglycolate phosphatase [Hyphomicrobiales bacterium]
MAASALVLDLDGTLVDTAPDLAQATNHVLAQNGRRPVTLDEIRSLVGLGARRLIRRGFALTGDELADDRVEALFEQFVDYYGEHISEHSRPFPGAIALLERCREAGIRLAVCTNKQEGLSLRLLADLGLSDYFSAVIGADTVGAAKPDAAPYHEAVRRAGATVSASLMVGDSGTDVLLARAVGVPVIAVTFGYCDRPVAEFEPDHLVDHFDDIWPLVSAGLVPAVSGLETA